MNIIIRRIAINATTPTNRPAHAIHFPTNSTIENQLYSQVIFIVSTSLFKGMYKSANLKTY